jgi:putative oxidoreductase
MEFLSRHRPTALGVLRILAGLLFMQHGAQKLFGWLGGTQAELFSLMGLAGIFEFFGGLLIVVGFMTRPVALVLMLEMLFAYFTAHLPQGFWPIQNGGELAALYAIIFLYLATAGPGRFAIDDVRREQVVEREPEPVTRAA